LETAKVDELCSYYMQCLRKKQLIKQKTANQLPLQLIEYCN